MALLVDPPRWPAHGTVWGHLVSDRSLEELHAFAVAVGVPMRGFDHDHYDVPAARYDDLIASGAVPVSGAELVRALQASGLRVRNRDRTPKRGAVLPGLRRDWARVLPDREALGAELLRRWGESHRHYHDVRHLSATLGALEVVEDAEEPPREVRLAAWFHDAVYEGRAGHDEEESALMAESELRAAGLGAGEAVEVGRLVRLTAHHRPEPGDAAGERLVDADLAILAAIPGRYDTYVRDVRVEYAHLDDDTFRRGRLGVLDRLLAREPQYLTAAGRQRWEDSARANLLREHARWEATPRESL